MFNKDQIKEQFPINSQTSITDRIVILKIITLFEKYNYCEIGSFLGGSLTPHLKNDKCKYILSIDDREKIQPDERGVMYDYQGVTSQGMINRLKELNLNVDKLRTFDKSIQFLTEFKKQFDLIFIDGEHTDIACFRDFLYSMRLVKDNGIILFHDSTIVYKGIQHCLIYLESIETHYKFIKVVDSEMSILFLGSYSTSLFEEENLNVFFNIAEKFRIDQLTKNRPIVKDIVSEPKIERVLK